MRFRRIKSVVVHAWHHLTHSMETWVDIFWYPMIQAFVFGGMAIFFASHAGGEAAQFVVLGLLLWYGMEAGSYSIAVGILWEVWARNFSTLFVSPLTIEEFVVGHMIFGLFKQLMTVIALSAVAYFTFHFSILSVGITLPIHLLLLMTFGWVVGMIALTMILRFGTRIQSVAWGLVYILQPMIGVFYPISVLPTPVQKAAFLLPPTYVFESARHAIQTGQPRWDYLLIATILNLVCLGGMYLVMKGAWEWARRAGALAKMEQ